MGKRYVLSLAANTFFIVLFSFTFFSSAHAQGRVTHVDLVV